MTTSSLARISEVWGSLTPTQQDSFTTLLETAADTNHVVTLTDDEQKLVAQSRRDFEAGHTYSFEESEAATDAFLRKLRLGL